MWYYKVSQGTTAYKISKHYVLLWYEVHGQKRTLRWEVMTHATKHKLQREVKQNALYARADYYRGDNLC